MPRKRTIAAVLVTGIVYFLLARGSLQLAFGQSNATPVWPPSGFAFAMLLLMGRRIAPGIALGAFAGNLVVFLSNQATDAFSAVLVSVCIAAGNTVEALAGQFLLKKFTRDAELQDIFREPKLNLYFLLSVAAMCLFGASIGSLSVLAGGIISPGIWQTTWLTWWTGDFSGVLLITPLLVSWVAIRHEENRKYYSRLYYMEALLIFTATLLMTSVIFLDLGPQRFLFNRAFILIPFFLVTVVRLNLREVVTLLSISSVMAIWGTTQGKGPLITTSMNESLLTVQLFISIVFGTKLILWSVIYQLRRNEELLQLSHDELDQRVKERTAALFESEEHFRKAFYSSPAAMTILEINSARIVDVNEACLRLLGYERNELIDRQPEETGIYVMPGLLKEQILAVKNKGYVKRQEFEFRKKSGEIGTGIYSAESIHLKGRLGIVSTILDVTDLKRAEVKLRDVNFVLTEAQRIASMGNWEWDIRKNTLSWSDEMYRIFGLDKDRFELTFERFIACVHPEDRQLLHDKVEYNLRHPQPFNNYYRIIRPDGAVRILERRGEVFLDGQGRPVKMSGTTQDVTERRLTEDMLKAKSDELVELNYTLHQSNRELERINTELSTFAYVASHDLQEPLRKIQTFASRILESESSGLSPAGLDYLNRLHRSVQRLHVLLDDLLAYSRLNTKEKVFESASLDKIVTEVEEEFREQLQETQGSLVREPLPKIMGIPFQLHQLFHNLISNSLKFAARDKPPVIRIRSMQQNGATVADMQLSSQQHYHHIEISDNGIGFDPEYNLRIFEVFQRLHGRNSYPGTGIGLAICKRVVENHQGAIRAEGKPGEGATFHIYLPSGKHAL